MGTEENEAVASRTADDGHVAVEAESISHTSTRMIRNVALVVAVVLLVELSVRIISPYLLPPQSPGVGEVALKHAQLRGRAAGGGVDLLFVGDSTLDAGIDPDAAAAATGRFTSGYNASLRGARLPTQRVWVFDRLLPMLRPRLVVQAVTPTFISTLGASPTDVTAFDTMLTKNLSSLEPDLWQRSDQIASDQLYLIRYRSSLRSPRLVGAAVWNRITSSEEFPADDLGPDYWERITAPNGQSIEYRLGTPRPESLTGLFATVRSMLDGGYSLTALDSMLDGYARRGVPLVVVIPPVATDLLTQGGVDMARWREMTNRIAEDGRARGLEVLDFSDRAYPTDWYFDPFHLNGTGSRQFSTDLGAAIDQACRRDSKLRCP